MENVPITQEVSVEYYNMISTIDPYPVERLLTLIDDETTTFLSLIIINFGIIINLKLMVEEINYRLTDILFLYTTQLQHVQYIGATSMSEMYFIYY